MAHTEVMFAHDAQLVADEKVVVGVDAPAEAVFDGEEAVEDVAVRHRNEHVLEAAHAHRLDIVAEALAGLHPGVCVVYACVCVLSKVGETMGPVG